MILESRCAMAQASHLDVSLQSISTNSHTGMSTLQPSRERAAAALVAKDAPTHAQVSSSEALAMKGCAAAVGRGKYLLHRRPAPCKLASEAARTQKPRFVVHSSSTLSACACAGQARCSRVSLHHITHAKLPYSAA